MVRFFKKDYIFLIIAVALILVYVLPLGSHPLIEPDEGRYAEIPREMIESGNYITPMLNYVKYFEKPAFLYWLNALSFHIFGENEFAARIGCALCAILGAVTTGMLASYIYGAFTGFSAFIICATSLLYFAIGEITLTDMPLSLFLTIAFASFYIAQDNNRNKKYYILFYFACAMALLTKGLIGIILPGTVILFYIFAVKKWRLFYEPLYLPGIILFVIISVPWFYAVCKANPDFFHFFFIQEHFLRYTTKMHDRYKPFWYFIPFIIAGVFPWTGFLFGLFSKKSILRSADYISKKSANIFLLLWFAVIFVFFSFSNSKLIPYIVPCIPPLAILIAADINLMLERNEVHGKPSFFVTLTCGPIVAALIVYSLIGKEITINESLPILIKSVPALLAFQIAVKLYLSNHNETEICTRFCRKFYTKWLLKDNKNIKHGIIILFICSLTIIWGLSGIFNLVAEQNSMKKIAYCIENIRKSNDRIVVYNDVVQGLSFYTKQRVMTIGYCGELKYGASQQEGAGWFISAEEFKELWKNKQYNYIVLSRKSKDYYSLFDKNEISKIKTENCGKYVILYR